MPLNDDEYSTVTMFPSGNLTEDDQEKASRHVQVYVLFLLATLAMLGNSAVILQLCRKRMREKCFSNINFLILQLAISDTLVALFCMLADGAWKATYQWLAGDFMCKFVKYMQMFALYTSTYIIVTIGLDRCIAIRFTLTRFDHKRVVKIMSVLAWSLAGICSLPQVMIFRVMEAPYSIEVGHFEQCVTYGAYMNDMQEQAYMAFTSCAMFFIPLLFITASYTLIFVKIRRESGPQSGIVSSTSCSRVNSFNSSTAERRDALMKKAKMKALCVSIIVIVTFLICWAPYYVSILYYFAVNKTSKDAHQLFQVIFFFGQSNSVLNPVVYGAFHMARRSQSAWRKWNRRFPHSTTGGHVMGEPESYSIVFSPLAKGHNYSISSRSTTTPHQQRHASFRVSHIRTPSRLAVGKTPSLDV